MFTNGLKVLMIGLLFVALLTGCTKNIPNTNSEVEQEDVTEITTEDKENTVIEEEPQTEVYKNRNGLVTNAEYVELPVGSSVKAMILILTIDEADNSLIYHSSDEAIVTVNDEGIMTGVSPGEAEIEVTFKVEPRIKLICKVHVVSEGVTLLYPKAPEVPTNPDDPDTKTDSDTQTDPDTKTDSDTQTTAEIPTEDNIPIAYDSTIPVEVIPSIDEFIWTIKIDHLFEWVTQQDELMLKVVFRLQMTGTKVGGKTPYGEYTFTGGMQSDFPEAEVDAFLSQSGGKVTTAFNPNYTIDTFTMSVTPMDAETYAGGQLDTVRKAMLKAGFSGMSLGTFTYNVGGSSTATTTDEDSSQTSTTEYARTASFPYKLKVSKSGFVFFQYETKATQNNIFRFEGKLYKTPIIPK